MTHDLYGELWVMNDTATNSGGWASCRVRTERLPEVLEKDFPDPIKGAVREVNKLTSAGNKSSVIVTTADKLFLLSEVEVFGHNANSVSGEGTPYDYYKTPNSTKKNYGNGAYDWWERSPPRNTSLHFCCVSPKVYYTYEYADEQLGIAFAFCL